jgi:hypothetical protein
MTGRKQPRKTGWERYNGDGTWKPEWLGIRRCGADSASFIASTLREDGTELGLGFSSITAHSFEVLLLKIKLIWGEVPCIVDLFCWQEQYSFVGDGI